MSVLTKGSSLTIHGKDEQQKLLKFLSAGFESQLVRWWCDKVYTLLIRVFVVCIMNSRVAAIHRRVELFEKKKPFTKDDDQQFFCAKNKDYFK